MNDELATTYDIRGTEATGLSVEYTWNIGKAFADWLPTDGRVLVTTTPTQEMIATAIIEGLRLQGRAVIGAGQLSKEQIIERVTSDHLSGAVLVSFDELEQVSVIELYQHDSHLITSETGLLDLLNLAQAGNFVPAAVKGELTALA